MQDISDLTTDQWQDAKVLDKFQVQRGNTSYYAMKAVHIHLKTNVNRVTALLWKDRAIEKNVTFLESGRFITVYSEKATFGRGKGDGSYSLFRCPVKIKAPRAFDRVPEHTRYMTQGCSQQPLLINTFNISLRIDKQYTFILLQVNLEGYLILYQSGIGPL